ncbi:aminoglycoside phosphotransferase family protein [Arthrobacter sp. zg-Y750]|uniref:aminoglycoside phosphotransferase family protein n=1 Tax=Arthrobacter sp. zg-Y750 TaxID=2894189 RepID=UPI001E347C8C|nr:aminoglycoside phosphotransferase family protein [Arthrobacter sp. zg-Y750]MCC9178856.1 aminoglycoside phosphotransferase family protein [Arthrobacter sp. zg-Y750]
MAPAVVVPDGLRRRYLGSRDGRSWLEGLPALAERSMAGFGATSDLSAAGQPWHGHGAMVLPVRLADGTPAVLKFPFPHPEAAAEAAALELWDGQGAVGLLDRDAAGTCLVLERLDPENSLLDVQMADAVRIWGSLVRRLSRPASDAPQWAAVPALAEHAEQLSDELPAEWEALGRPFERWLLEAALQVCQTRGAVGRRSSRDVLVHGDLHYANVLARPGKPGEYAAIDPQAVFGEPEYAVAPMLWNRLQDLDAQAPETALLARLDALCSAAGLDRSAALDWSVLREVANAVDYVRLGRHGDAQRSMWVASTLTGRRHPGVPPVSELPAA